jgi:sugar phosphate isomerase/epimerase
MKTSIFTVSFAGLWGQQKLSLEESIDLAADLGYQGVELIGKRPHLSPLDYSVDDCKQLRERIEKNGLQCSAVAGYTNFLGGLEAGEVPFVDMQVDYVTQLAERAAALGSDLVRIFTSYERDDMPWFAQWKKNVDAIAECCDRAADFGVTIGVQNHHDIAVHTKVLDELMYAIGRDNVIPMWDCWSPHLRGEDLRAGAKLMAKRMRFTTVADYTVLPRHKYLPELVNYDQAGPPAVLAVAMGDGDLDYKTFFDALKDEGFAGWVSYENCSPLRDGGSLETLKRYSQRFVDYMKPWIG